LTARSWSRDGVTWSDPRIGGYNATISFPNGTSMNCRRERPQILLDPESGEPIGISNGVQVLTTETTRDFDLGCSGLAFTPNGPGGSLLPVGLNCHSQCLFLCGGACVQCPRSFGVFTGSKNLGGNMDSYTSVQMLNGSQAKYH
jgi:hypothetical protein